MPTKDPPEILHLPTNSKCKMKGHELINKEGHATKHLAWFHENGMPFCNTCHDDYQKQKDTAARPKDDKGKEYTHCENGHELHHKNIAHISAGAAGVYSFCLDCANTIKKAINPPKGFLPEGASRNIRGIGDRAEARMAWHGPISHTRLAGNHTHCVRCGEAFKPGEEMTLEHVMPLARGGSNTDNNILWSHREGNVAAGASPVSMEQYERWHQNAYGKPLSEGQKSLYQGIQSFHKRNEVGVTPMMHHAAWENFHSLRHSWNDEMAQQMFEELTPQARRAYKKWQQTRMPARFTDDPKQEVDKWKNFRNYRIGNFEPEFNEQGQLTNQYVRGGKLHGSVKNWFDKLQGDLADRGVKINGQRIVNPNGEIHSAWKDRWNEMMNNPLKVHGPSGAVVPHRTLATVLQAAHENQMAEWNKLSPAQREAPAITADLRARVLQRQKEEKAAKLGKPVDQVRVGTFIGVRKSCSPTESLSERPKRPLVIMRPGNSQKGTIASQVLTFRK